MLAETGFRIGEVLGIRYTEDIDYENHTIKVIFREDNENYARAKNAEIRRAKISNETFDILMFYIAENRKMLNKTKYLFITLSGNTKGQPLTANAVYSVFRLLKKKTGIAVTPHMLRHYYANERRKVGWSLDKISKALGHKQLATTESYMNIEDKDYLKLFLLTKGNSRTVCYRMMDIMQENIASKEPGFLMENCLFSYSWKGSLAAGGVKLNFVKQCSY